MKSAVGAVLLVLLVGCNQLYQLDETKVLDAFVAPDQDGDGTSDTSDNCIDVPNDQIDSDDDGLGDACDNCPLVANRLQEREGDDDAVGDACDPHTRTGGDCLIALDVFRDATEFDHHWQVRTGSAAAPTLAHGERVVTITPNDGLPIALVALDGQGVPYSGVFDTQMLGSVTITTGSVFAMSNVSTPGSGNGCGLGFYPQPAYPDPIPLAMTASPTSVWTFPGFLSNKPVNSSALLRLTAPTLPDGGFLCVATYGLAVGAANTFAYSRYSPGPGAPGVTITKDALTLSAVALYRSQSDACPNTVYR